VRTTRVWRRVLGVEHTVIESVELETDGRGQEVLVESPQRRALSELQNARVRFTPQGPTGIVEVTAEASKPRVALDIANTYIEVLLSRTRSFNVDDTKVTREGGQRSCRSLGHSPGGARNNLQRAHLSQIGDEALCHPVSEVGAVQAARGLLERQHRDSGDYARS